MTDVLTDTSGSELATISDKLLSLIIDAVEKKPSTAPEALALVEYIWQKDLLPLLEKLRAWAVSEMVAEEKLLAQKLWAEVQLLEQKAVATGWCVCIPK